MSELDPELPLDKLSYRIGEASQLVGVEPHVLRYWENEFQLHPRRSASGQRLYAREDIAYFLQIRDLLHEQGFTIAGARKILEEGAAPAAVDVERIEDVRERIQQVRERISGLQERFGAVGLGSLRSDGREPER